MRSNENVARRVSKGVPRVDVAIGNRAIARDKARSAAESRISMVAFVPATPLLTQRAMKLLRLLSFFQIKQLQVERGDADLDLPQRQR